MQEQQHVNVIGALDMQLQGGKIVTSRQRFIAGRGYEEQLMLQIISPFGGRFSMKLLLDRRSAGSQLLQEAFVGCPYIASGTLEWERQPVYGLPEAIQLKRSSMSCSLRVAQLRHAQGNEEFGCDISMVGTIVAAPRIVPHPLRPSILLASTILETQQTEQRTGSRAQFKDIQRIPIVIPAQHQDAPNLLRLGNRVYIEGMLERVPVELKGQDIDQALEALQLDWMQQQQHIKGLEEREKAERHYLSLRHRIQYSQVSRIVVGFAELLAGSTQSLRAAQSARRKQRRAAAAHQSPLAM